MEFTAAKTRLIDSLSERIHDTRVLETLKRIPRELFVPLNSLSCAYDDRPLPIGLNQTISQPYIVALMTQALELTGSEKVLEIGTGSGYQAAVLSTLARTVISTERLPELAHNAESALRKLNCSNVTIHLAEDTLGWRQDAPYDAIAVTAGAPRIPRGLIEQLTIGGRMVIPVGDYRVQELYKVIRTADSYVTEFLCTCCFVPLIGNDAWDNKN